VIARRANSESSRTDGAPTPAVPPSLLSCCRYFWRLGDAFDGERRDYLFRHWGRLARVAHRALTLTVRGARILEAGCAWGDLAEFLAQNQRRVVGIDFWYAPGVPTTFDYYRLNLETDPLPFPDAFFDCVLLTEVIEHFVLSPLPPLREIARVTRPGGAILISTPNQLGIGHLLKFLANRSNAFQSLESKLAGPWTPSRFHNHVYTLRELRTLCCEHAGLEARRLRYTNFLPSRGWSVLPREAVRHGAGTLLPVLRTYVFGEFLASSPKPEQDP